MSDNPNKFFFETNGTPIIVNNNIEINILASLQPATFFHSVDRSIFMNIPFSISLISPLFTPGKYSL